MTDDELLKLAKMSLRITTTAYDTELSALITQAQAEITKSCDTDYDESAIDEQRLIVDYCRAFFGAGDELAERRYKEQLARLGIRKCGGTSG